MQRIQIIIKGRVQGVYFRHSTKQTAILLGITGYVRNLADGSVEAVAEGEEEKLKELLKFCRKGPIGAEVTDVQANYSQPKKEFASFEIRY